MQEFLRSLKMLMWMILLTGIIYPLLITAIGQLFFNKQANGSLIYDQTVAKGSMLIGQKFTREDYFWSRPSMADYDPLKSTGSNLGPTSRELKNLVEQRAKNLEKYKLSKDSIIPAELLFASGSGLDPHIDLETTYFQLPRVAKARGIDEAKLRQLIEDHLEGTYFRLIGKPRINVLLLNRSLDQLKKV